VAFEAAGPATVTLSGLLAVAGLAWSHAQPIKKQPVIETIIARSAFIIPV
jgi:hypothetical protein